MSVRGRPESQPITAVTHEHLLSGPYSSNSPPCDQLVADRCLLELREAFIASVFGAWLRRCEDETAINLNFVRIRRGAVGESWLSQAREPLCSNQRLREVQPKAHAHSLIQHRQRHIKMPKSSLQILYGAMAACQGPEGTQHPSVSIANHNHEGNILLNNGMGIRKKTHSCVLR
jgi:hypothetical protein